MATAFEDLRILQNTERIADAIWQHAYHWESFVRDTIGKQLTRAIDSVGANIAESYGRYHFGEKRQFLYYARGSLFESKYWLNRCLERGILQATEVEQYAQQLTTVAKQLNKFAKSINEQKTTYKKMREPETMYQVTTDLFSEQELLWLSDINNNSESPISNLQSPISTSPISNSPNLQSLISNSPKEPNPYE